MKKNNTNAYVQIMVKIKLQEQTINNIKVIQFDLLNLSKKDISKITFSRNFKGFY